MEHHDYSGYHVDCPDAVACAARRDAALVQARADRARRNALATASRAMRSMMAHAELGGRAPQGIPIAIRIVLGSRSAGSEFLTVHADGSVSYCESSYDGGYDWYSPSMPANFAARLFELESAMRAAPESVRTEGMRIEYATEPTGVVA